MAVSTGGAHSSGTEETDAEVEPSETVKESKPTAVVPESAPPKPTAKSDALDATHPVDTASSKLDATEVKVASESSVADQSEPPHVYSLAAQTMSSTTQLQAAVASEPVVPSLRPWPTAFDPVTAVTYVAGLVTSFVSAVLSPFAAGLPALPADPSPWALLAWVRRELFNGSPTHHPGGQPADETDITGNVGAVDPEGDPLTYTVIGRPQNGGTVEIDQAGNFTYRPMNAMAAVGGTDQFTVVVSDEAAGFHVHGPLGLLQVRADPWQLPQSRRR